MKLQHLILKLCTRICLHAVTQKGLLHGITICGETRKTRTHSMARHRKSPRSRRNLMVIEGHQFDRR